MADVLGNMARLCSGQHGQMSSATWQHGQNMSWATWPMSSATWPEYVLGNMARCPRQHGRQHGQNMSWATWPDVLGESCSFVFSNARIPDFSELSAAAFARRVCYLLCAIAKTRAILHNVEFGATKRGDPHSVEQPPGQQLGPGRPTGRRLSSGRRGGRSRRRRGRRGRGGTRCSIRGRPPPQG